MPIYSDKTEVLIMQYSDGNGANRRDPWIRSPQATPNGQSIAISKSQFPPNPNGHLQFFFIHRSIEKEGFQSLKKQETIPNAVLFSMSTVDQNRKHNFLIFNRFQAGFDL